MNASPKKIEDNKIRSEIINLDGSQILREIGLENNITSQRMNGFLSALNTVKSLVDGYERN